jgi:hypothetical protein
MSSIRVLVVEDFAPFVQFIRQTLAEKPDLQQPLRHRDAVCSGFPIAPVTRIGFAMFVLIRTTQPFH